MSIVDQVVTEALDRRIVLACYSKILDSWGRAISCSLQHPHIHTFPNFQVSFEAYHPRLNLRPFWPFGQETSLLMRSSLWHNLSLMLPARGKRLEHRPKIRFRSQSTRNKPLVLDVFICGVSGRARTHA